MKTKTLAGMATLLGMTVISSCGQTPQSVTSENASTLMKSDQAYIESIQKKIDSGELKPSFTIGEADISEQAITSNDSRYSCTGYNILDGVIAGANQVGGHIYLTCTTTMSYMEMSGNIYTSDYSVLGQTKSDYRESWQYPKQLLVTLNTVPYIRGKTYCATSFAQVVFPGETTLKSQPSRLPDCKVL